MSKGLTFELNYYIELLELTGRCIRADKRGHISDAQPILARLQITPVRHLLYAFSIFGPYF